MRTFMPALLSFLSLTPLLRVPMQPLPSRADYRTAVKRMHADLHALERHGGDLGIDCDPIRVSHAYGAQLAAIFPGSTKPSCEAHCAYTRTLQLSSCSSNANTATSSGSVIHASSECDSLQTSTSSPLANSATSCCFSTAIASGSNFSSIHPIANTATSSGFVFKNSPGCDSLQISANSLHSNFATSSGGSTAHHSTVTQQRASCNFDGIDPNGSDAKLGRPAKQRRLR